MKVEQQCTDLQDYHHKEKGIEQYCWGEYTYKEGWLGQIWGLFRYL